MLRRATAAAARLQIKKQVELFDFDATDVGGLAGMTAANHPWHTPGMASFTLPWGAAGPGGQPLVVTGDALHHIQFSIETPLFTHLFDQEPAQGPAGRYGLLDHAVATRARLAVSHAAWPGLGSVAPLIPTTFRWLPEVWATSCDVQTTCPAELRM
jgi:hypothetical protein